MAMERMRCQHCHGEKVEPRDVPSYTVTCDLGFEHKFPERKKGQFCHECGGDGYVLEPNFGRQ